MKLLKQPLILKNQKRNGQKKGIDSLVEELNDKYKELYDIVICDCGTPKEAEYEGNLVCGRKYDFKDKEKDGSLSWSVDKWYKHTKKYKNADDGNITDLELFNFIKMLKIKYKF